MKFIQKVFLRLSWLFFSVLFQSSQTKSGAGAIAGGVVAVLIVLVTVGVVGVIYKR